MEGAVRGEDRAHGLPVLIGSGGKSETLSPIALAEPGKDAISEGQLQALIHEHPQCLPIQQIEPRFESPIAVCREMPVGTGQLDNLLMTARGDIVIVETKLWRNPEARRKVIAQALDYASQLFEMDYAKFEAAALRGRFSGGAKPKSLYHLFESGNEALKESSFVDAVNTNLRKGRALILVVGDGIHTELVQLTTLLQSHAGARFTFALIELSLFRVPQGGGTLLCPRILMRTLLIERGVVAIDGAGVKISPSQTKASEAATTSRSISEEQFYEAIAELDSSLPQQLRAFLEGLEPLGVYPEYMKSLNLKWEVPDGRPFNFGYIKPSGHLWTDAANWSDDIGGDARRELGHQYNERLASALGMKVNRDGKTGWKVMTLNGRMPKITDIVPKFDAWHAIIEEFVGKLAHHYKLSS